MVAALEKTHKSGFSFVWPIRQRQAKRRQITLPSLMI
jgi:hypothetical protein